MSGKQRTSISLSGEALKAAQERREALGYESLSEYIEFLILEDARQKRKHAVIRGEGGVRYETVPERQYGEEPPTERYFYPPGQDPSFPLIAEPGPSESPFSPGDAPPASPGDFSRTASS